MSLFNEFIGTKDEFNMITCFIKEQVEKDTNSNNYVTTYDLYDAFKSWYNQMYKDTKCMEYSEFVDLLRSLWVIGGNGLYYGIKIKHS